MGVIYRVESGFDYAGIEVGTVDLFYTFSVLQRVHLDDLDTLIANSLSLLRPGGRCCHRVHMKDFHAITDRRIPPYFYLTISSGLWKLMTSRFVNYQNRQRVWFFEERLQSAGFENVNRDAVEIDTSQIPFVEEHLQGKFGSREPAEIATWQTDFHATCPS